MADIPGKATALKNRIFFHRSYRKLPRITPFDILTELLILALPFTALTVAFYPDLTRAIAETAYRILAIAAPEKYLAVAEVPSYIKPLYGLVIPDRFPSVGFSAAVLAFSTLVIFGTWSMRQMAKPLGSWAVFISIINLIASAVFIVVPEKFPYTGAMFSGLYLQTQLTVWILIPPVLTLSMLPLPGVRTEKFLLILSALAYSILFGAARFAFFMAVLYRYSLLFVPAMIFAVGPMLDFIFVVGFYSFYVSRISVKLKRSEKTWHWLY